MEDGKGKKEEKNELPFWYFTLGSQRSAPCRFEVTS
jgi:hypothetical protein